MQLSAKMSCYATLKQQGMRITRPRRMILDFIHDSGGHITAEEIISFVHQRYPHVNKSTVYRTLEVLEANDCVFKSELDGHAIYHHAEEGHHHHLRCKKCGRIIPCEENIFLPVEQRLIEKYGFQIHFKHLMMVGLCRRCSNTG